MKVSIPGYVSERYRVFLRSNLYEESLGIIPQQTAKSRQNFSELDISGATEIIPASETRHVRGLIDAFA